MSWKSAQDGDRTKRTGWSGAGPSREKPLHRWQDATAAADGNKTHRRQQRSRWVLSSVIALGLLGFLVWLLLQWQPKSQLIVFTATQYAPPIPLNSWADEDREALAALDRVNLLMTDGSDQWNKDHSTEIKFSPDTMEPTGRRRSTPLILYFSMH